MKKFLRPIQISILAVLLLLPNSLTAFAAPTPPEFTSTEGNFGIKFPGTPTTAEIPITSGTFPTTMHLFIYETTEGAAKNYLAAYTDALETPLSKKETTEFFKGEERGELDYFKIKKAAKETKNTYKGYPGFFYKAKGKDLYIVTQTYLVGTRLYQIQIQQGKKYPTDKEIKAFIGSFRFLKK